MNDRLGATRYWAFVDKTTGRIFARWGGKNPESHQKRAAEADIISKKNARGRLKRSCSEMINRRGLEEGISKPVIWKNRHRLWLYGAPSSVELPSSLMVRELAHAPRSFNVDPKCAGRARSSLGVPESCSEDSDTQRSDIESSYSENDISGSESDYAKMDRRGGEKRRTAVPIVASCIFGR